MKYLAVLGRQPKISLAELEAQFGESVRQIAPSLAVFEAQERPEINRFGGVMKFGELIEDGGAMKSALESSGPDLRGAHARRSETGTKMLPDFIQALVPDGKIVLGVSEYGRRASARTSEHEAMRLKKILARAGRSVRVLKCDKSGALSTATAHHNQLGEKAGHIELIKVGSEWYLGVGVQNITAYAHRDQARPARDAKVGMLPPKLAQILINLCGPLESGSVVLDPFCGTGVVLQEALLMGYVPMGTDLSERMIEYSVKNLKWLVNGEYPNKYPAVCLLAQAIGGEMDFEKQVRQGDATEFKWGEMVKAIKDGTSRGGGGGRGEMERRTEIVTAGGRSSSGEGRDGEAKISAVACEIYLGSPMSQPPAEIKLKTEKQECSRILLGFLKNIAPQISSGTPLTLAVPAWLRPDGSYSRLNLLDEIVAVGYNVRKLRSVSEKDLLYYRDGQVVAREIILLRKK